MTQFELNPKNLIKMTIAVICVIGTIILISFAGSAFEGVDAEEIVIIQDPIDGELHVYTTPGLKYQNFGTATRYQKSSQF